MTERQVATMEQRGGPGIGVAVVAGLVLFAITRRAGAAAGPTPTITGLGAVGEVRNLSIAVANPLNKTPGSIAGISQVAFDYKGPAQSIFIVWGIKPAGGFFGINFDNGDHLIERPVKAWSQLSIAVPATGAFTRINPNFSGTRANIAIPDPGVPQFGRNGGAVNLNFGTADVWVWVISGAAVRAAASRAELDSALTSENNILVIDTNADVFNIIELSAAAAALSVSFL